MDKGFPAGKNISKAQVLSLDLLLQHTISTLGQRVREGPNSASTLREIPTSVLVAFPAIPFLCLVFILKVFLAQRLHLSEVPESGR